MTSSEHFKTETFWKLNSSKMLYMLLASAIIGLGISIGSAYFLHNFNNKDIPIWTIPITGFCIGLILAISVFLTSLYSFGQINKYVGSIVIDTDDNLTDTKFIYTDLGSKWHFYELRIQGFYKGRAITVYYEPKHNQLNDQRGLYFCIKSEENSQHEQKFFMPFKVIKQLDKINLSNTLSELI